MEFITSHSISRAADEAVKIWALASTQYPQKNELILEIASTSIIETISTFALNARKSLEILPKSDKFSLSQPRWDWEPSNGGIIINDLWDGLNSIIHAQKLHVGFEKIPTNIAIIDGGSLVVPYIKAQTDKKPLSFIDPFAMSHAFLYKVYPKLKSKYQDSKKC